MILILQDTVHSKKLLTVDLGTSARCFSIRLLAGFLGLGRPTALALLTFSLQLAKVFSASFGDLLPTLPSKLDGGGIFLSWQNLEDATLAPDCIMHDPQSTPKENAERLASFPDRRFRTPFLIAGGY